MGGELGDTCKLELEGLFVNPSWAFGFVALADALELSLAASVMFWYRDGDPGREWGGESGIWKSAVSEPLDSKFKGGSCSLDAIVE